MCQRGRLVLSCSSAKRSCLPVRRCLRDGHTAVTRQRHSPAVTIKTLVPTLSLALIVAASIAPLAERPPAAPEWPGFRGAGVTLLPNGWRIAPAGRSLQVGDFPLSMVQ